MLQLMGWIGSIMFAICCIPQAVHTYRQGNSDGLIWPTLLLWFFGEVFTVVYVLPKQDWPLLFNYAVNLVCLLVILKFKIWPRK